MKNLSNLLTKLKDPRTNWKCILIVVILAFIAGGGIFTWQWWLKKYEIEILKIKPSQRIQKEVKEVITELKVSGSRWYYQGGDTYPGYLIFHPDGMVELPRGWFAPELQKGSLKWQYNPEKELLTIDFKSVPNLFPENESLAKDSFRPFVNYDKENFSVTIQVTSETEAIVFFGWVFSKE